jgi:hypothetical protein
MPDCQAAEILFMALIGAFTTTLLFLAFREDRLRAKGR